MQQSPRGEARTGVTKNHMTDKKKKESLGIIPSFTETRNHFCNKKQVTKVTAQNVKIC